ncbi:MAG: efflux RND transporter permease subunit [Candidatus Caenarcaniphilales bacterium]|nr:efflux RND transporter permease subunit [Candidatus Caenarcaniphilales bacterium]
MTIAEWCIKNNRTASLIFVIIVLLGASVYVAIGRKEYPEISVKTAVITTVFEGATPIKVEELVTDKIEDELSEISEIEKITSQSLPGVSVIKATLYDYCRDTKPIWDRLRNKVEDAIPSLPDGASKPVVNDEYGDHFPIVVAITGDGFNMRELKDIAEDLRDEILTQDSVAKVEIHGVQDENIFLEFSNSRLAKYGFTPTDLANVLSSENIVKPSGDIKFQNERLIFEASGNYESMEKLRKTSLRQANSRQAVHLEDIVDIKRAYVDPPESISRYNGERALMVAIGMKDGRNILKMGTAIKKLVHEYKANIPLGINFDFAVYQAKYVERSINDFIVNLLEAFAFVLVVVMSFVGMRMGLIVGSLIPMVTCVCMISLSIFEVKLQMISLAALIIALGMLVDNAVVVSENITVRLNQGEERLSAVKSCMQEQTIPLLAASLTTIFAFLPIPLAKSATGEFTFSLFVVICTALLASWLLSISFIPMICYYFLKVKEQKESHDGSFYSVYKKILFFCLQRPKKFLIIIAFLLLTSLWGFGFVDKNFFPPNEREMLTIDFWQPYGVDISTTERRLKRLEEFIMNDEEYVSLMSFVGSGGPRWYQLLNPEDPNDSYAMLVITTKSFKGSLKFKERINNFLKIELPEVRASISSLQNGPPVKNPIEVRISGDDIPTLYKYRDVIISYIQEIPGAINIRDDWGEWTKKIFVDISQDKAKRAGLTSKDIAQSLQTQFSGLQATEFREGDEIIPIMLRSKDYYRKDAGHINSINVYSSLNTNNVPLSQVADIKINWQASNVRNRNRKRTITVKANLEDGYFATRALEVLKPKIEKYMKSDEWKSNYKVSYGGESEESNKAQRSIFAGMPIAISLLLLVLMYQFNSIRKVAIIGLTIPPMLIGVTPGLYFTKAAFGFFALLGFISLMGIIVNNAIMMLDRIRIEQDSGKSLEDSIVSSALQRLRPILMTAITTTISLIPLSLQGGEMWRPMANTIIFGLVFSTILTLVMCPVLYSLFYKADFSKVDITVTS